MAEEHDWDKGLKAAFGPGKDLPEGGESVLAAIEEATGANAQVLLRDEPGDESPLLKLHPPDSEEAAKDDLRYQVVGEIARGGVGVIFKGRDRDLGRDVAIKVLRKEHAARPEIVQRFIEEAQIEGQLQHPGIIPVYGLGLQPDGRPYFAMKLVKGKTLSAVLAERTDPKEDRSRYLAMFEQVAQAMAYAHARGVIHRDLKPSNILVGAFGEVLVVDWGFAKVLGTKEPEAPKGPATPPLTIVATVRTGSEGSQSIAGSVMGTPAYMPPEQALGHVEQLDTRSDVFALGAILAEILTGEPPYVGESDDQLVMASQARLDDAYARLGTCGADPEIVKLCRKCLAPLKGDRPRDASAPAMAISQHLAAQEERAREAEVDAAREKARAVKEKSESERERAKEASERRKVKWERLARRRTIGVAAALLLAVILGGGAFLKLQGDRRTRAERAQAAVARAVEEAELLRGEKRWPEAIEKARGAAELAGVEGVPEETRTETAALLQAVEAEMSLAAEAAAKVENDRAFLARLNRIRLEHADRFRIRRTDAELEAAFRENGIDIEALESEEAGRRIAATTQSAEIAAILDWWAALASRPQYRELIADRNIRRLLRVSEFADPVPMRNRIRRAITEWDSNALREIAESSYAVELPLVTLVTLSVAVGEAGEPETAIRLLFDLQRRRPDSFRANYLLAHYLHKTEPRSGRAVRYGRAAVALRPESPSAWNVLGVAQSHFGDNDGFVLSIRRALKLDPEHPGALANISIGLRAQGKLGEAEKVCRQVLENEPGSPYALRVLADVLGQKGEFEDAVRLCEEAIRLDSTDPYCYSSLVHGLTVQGEFERAIEVGREGLGHCRYDSERANLLSYLAYVHLGLGDLEEAERESSEALRLDPKLSNAKVALGLVQYRRGDRGAAEETLRKVVRLDPYCDSAWHNLGLTLLDRGVLDEAIQAYEKAVELVPLRAVYHASLGVAYGEADRFEEAIASCLEAIRLDPRHAVSHANLGMYLEAKGEHDKAIAAYREAISRDSSLPAPWSNLAGALCRKGEIANALAAAREAVRLAPERGETWVNLALCRHANGDLDGAIEAARKAVVLNPMLAGAMADLAVYLATKGHLDEAIEAAETAVQLNPRLARAHGDLARLYQLQGRYREAVETYQRAIALRSDLSMLWCIGSLAWLLATCPEEELRDPAEAIRLARKGLTLAPGNWAILNTLGVAHYRAGSFEEARRALMESVELGKGSMEDGLFLAMTCWQLGEKAKAREWYEKGLQWAKERPPGNPEEFARFRAEAEALLGTKAEGR